MDEIPCVTYVCCGAEGTCTARKRGRREDPTLLKGVNKIT